jgi:prolyl-tRNA synthetase
MVKDMVKEKSEKLPPKENFSEWYHEVIEKAEIVDVRYPVKGLYVYFPFGYKIRRYVYQKLRDLLDREYDEVYFPALIPESELAKEGEHIKGFENEVYWITHGGRSPLDIKLALRPTSETAMYPLFKLWVRSHADLPLRTYQIVNTFRYETKHTRPLIRMREITSFKEAHTVQATYDDAEEQVLSANKLYKEFYDFLALPYLVIRRPEWDKFPGAVYSIAFDTVMPDGRTLQIGTSHHLGDNFARTFDIKYEKMDGEHEYAHQTCHGISDRCISALISIHGDDLGLVLPFEVAPVQIVIIPVLYKGEEEKIMELVNKLKEKLSDYRVIVDDSDERPGAKYYKWELKGAALRIEIGPREVQEGKVVVSFRNERKKFSVPADDVDKKIEEFAAEMKKQMYESALEKMRAFIKYFDDTDRLEEWVGRGVGLIHLCNSEECGEQIEEEAKGSVLGNFEEIPDWIDVEPVGECIVCGRKGYLTAVAKPY